MNLFSVQASDAQINKFKNELDKELITLSNALGASRHLLSIEPSITYKYTKEGEIIDIGTKLEIEFANSYTAGSIDLFGLLSNIPNLRNLELKLIYRRSDIIPYCPKWKKTLEGIEVLKINHKSIIPEWWYEKKEDYTELFLSSIKELARDSLLQEPKGWKISNHKLSFRDSLPSCFQKFALNYSQQLDSLEINRNNNIRELEIKLKQGDRLTDLNPFLRKIPLLLNLEVKGSWWYADSIDLIAPIKLEAAPLLYDLKLNYSQFNFPSWVKDFENLRILHLPNHSGKTADWSVFNSFPKLAILKFNTGDEQFILDSLGEEVSTLPNLKLLDISFSRVKQLPLSLLHHDSIKYIDIDETLIDKKAIIEQYPNLKEKLLGNPQSNRNH